MKCALCGQYGIYWKNLCTNPFTYCPYCKHTNCNELQEECEEENDEELTQ